MGVTVAAGLGPVGIPKRVVVLRKRDGDGAVGHDRDGIVGLKYFEGLAGTRGCRTN